MSGFYILLESLTACLAVGFTPGQVPRQTRLRVKAYRNDVGVKVPFDTYDATDCSIASRFPQSSKHSKSANLLRKLLLPQCFGASRVKKFFLQAGNFLTFDTCVMKYNAHL